MGKLNALLDDAKVKKIVFGLSKSHFNAVQLLGKNYIITPENISHIYAATIKYYNAGFAREAGVINQPENIIEEYLILIKLMFFEELAKEKTVVSMNDIKENQVLMDYSLFSLFTILINFKYIRLAFWEDLSTAEFTIKEFYNTIYTTSSEVLRQSEKTKTSLTIDKWKSVATNIVWNVRERSKLIDDLE